MGISDHDVWVFTVAALGYRILGCGQAQGLGYTVSEAN